MPNYYLANAIGNYNESGFPQKLNTENLLDYITIKQSFGRKDFVNHPSQGINNANRSWYCPAEKVCYDWLVDVSPEATTCDCEMQKFWFKEEEGYDEKVHHDHICKKRVHGSETLPQYWPWKATRQEMQENALKFKKSVFEKLTK
jgi:hypothetical protein